MTVLPPQADLSGTWTGTFQATAGANACGDTASGNATLVVAQDDANVAGNLNYQVTAFTPKQDPPDDCANLSPAGAIPINAVPSGNSLAGGGFTLTLQKTQAGSELSGTYDGVVQGFRFTCRFASASNADATTGRTVASRRSPRRLRHTWGSGSAAPRPLRSRS